MLAQRLGLPDAVDAHDAGKAPCLPGGHAGKRVLEDRGPTGRHAKRSRAGQEGVRRRLPLEALALGHLPVDADLEEPLEAGGEEYVVGGGARRHHSAAKAGVEAGRAGAFGHVVGVDRVGHADDLRTHGADVVVQDLAELLGDA